MIRLTLYGFPESPFSNHFKNYNAKSIKPIHYNYSNIINYKLKVTSIKKESGQVDWLYALTPKDKQVFEHYKL